MGFITGQEYTQAIADKAESGTGEVKLTMETALTRLEGIDITHPGATVGDTFLEGLRSKTSEARDVITNDLGGEVESALEDTKQYFTDGGENSADAFAMSLMDQTMGVADAAEEVGAAATEELDDSKYDAEDAGENVGYGFGDGMSNTSGYAESAARDIAARALRAMAEELDINSPSKETMKLGRFGGIGFGNGFAGTIGYVKKKASSLADTGLYAMQSVMEKLRDSLNFTPDMDPTISPVMDLSQIQNGMNRIGNMFGSQQFAVAGAFGMDPYAFRSIRAVTAAADANPRGNDDVVSAVNSLGKDISTLKTAMEQMKFEVNGKAIGEVAYREVDRRLGNTVTRNRREGRG
jgi:hypothetical protein